MGPRPGSRAACRWFSATLPLLVLGTFAVPAWASFPGRNGTIVYGWTSANKEVGSPTSIRTVDPGSGQVRMLRDCPLRTDRPPVVQPDCQVTAPRYSPRGRRIAFPAVQISNVPPQPWQLRPGLGRMVWNGAGYEEHATPHTYLRLAWSPAGDRFLLERQLDPEVVGGNAVFLASLDGTELDQVAGEWTSMPDWSSRGAIAYVRSRTDARCYPRCEDIFLTRLGGRPRRLTYRGGFSPSWSPQGTKLAFVRSLRPGSSDIYIVRRNGRGLRRLTHRGGYSPAWSPDGKRIAFLREGDVYLANKGGGGLRRLVDEQPAFSDGLGPQATSVDWQPLPRQRHG
jgi:dipeptidyl aminopeptidase/acylaminoacyl peptidase